MSGDGVRPRPIRGIHLMCRRRPHDRVDASAGTDVGSYGFYIFDRISLAGQLIRRSAPSDPGPPKDRTPLDPVRKAEAKRRAAAGESTERIAEDFDVHPSVVYSAVHSFD